MKTTRWMQPGSAFPWLAALLLALGLVACGSSDDDDPLRPGIAANSTLSGEQEVPPVLTGAIGSGTVTVDPSNFLSGAITLDGITATAAHIHSGAVGENGPILITLAQTTPGVWSVPSGTAVSDAHRAALVDGALYFNAHSAANPDGEIRGQIGRDVFSGPLSPAQEVPPPVSVATGSGRLILDPATRRITARVTVSGMVAIAAHIHSGAPGVNGPILFPLTETPAGSGIWVSAADATLTPAQLDLLRAGELYFNAHSVAFPNGEIRGQIARHVSAVMLTGAQEVPPTPSAATGTGTFVIDPTNRATTGSIRVSGMTTVAAHIHIGAVGVNGPIIVPLANTAVDVWSVPANTRLSADHYAAFKRGELYVNAHSAQFPGGEIRAQLR